MSPRLLQPHTCQSPSFLLTMQSITITCIRKTTATKCLGLAEYYYRIMRLPPNLLSSRMFILGDSAMNMILFEHYTLCTQEIFYISMVGSVFNYDGMSTCHGKYLKYN